MAFAETLSEFFDTAQGFAVPATYNGTATVNGIFDAIYLEDMPGTAGIQSANPLFTCAAASVPNAAQGDLLVIGSTTYTVVEVHPDGTGLVALQLRK